MARLDRLIQLLHEHQAQGLALTPGQPASLLFEAGPRTITRDALTAAQLLPLLREIAAPADQGRLDGRSAVSFGYQAPGGVVQVEVMPGDGGIRAVIRSSVPAPAAASPPPPAAAVATNGEREAARERMERLFRLTLELKASDLHLRPGEPPILRRDGEMHRQEGEPLSGELIEAMMLSIMSPEDQAAYRETGDVDWAYELPAAARFRCNGARERRGPFGVFRVIPSRILSADELGLSPEVQKLCSLTKGLVLVTGPTGSGKSTTLAGMVDLVNRSRSDHLLTIEDPIEFVHTPRKCVVTQRQVGPHSRSFKAALRAALREDPDIILVGELRDLETVAIALETAETGHLVFGTLHTTTAASTVDRIIDQFPADRQSQVRVMLAESLKGVIAQVLCRKVGGGRVAAKEVLLSTPSVSNLIREGKTFQIPSIMQTGRKLGMVTLGDALLELVDQRQIEPREAWLKAVDKPAMLQALRTRKHDTNFAGEG